MLRAVFNFWKEAKLEQMNRTAVYKQLQKVVQDFQLKWVKIFELDSRFKIHKATLFIVHN